MNTRTQLLEMPGRYIGARLPFLVGCGIEPGMFDSDDVAFSQALAEFLLEFSQNALRKRKLSESVIIRASFRCDDAIEFSVCDSGAPVAADVLRGLLRGPVPSETGFGIGLYQTNRLAEISGFSLQLSQNDAGRVCFSLRGEVRRGARQA